MTLKELEVGKSAVIRRVGGEGALRQHFLDMGMIPGAEVTVIKLAPMGDPMEVQVHGYELTLRLAEAQQIDIQPIGRRSRSHTFKDRAKDQDHPGLGENGKFHSKADEHPLPDGTVLTYALVGNQNCGKTTLFNQLTGAKQHVGNFPGVTVDRKSGAIRGYPNTEVTDLPGIYSMSPFSSEEIVSRNFVLQDKPTAIINIVDATNIERNLYLSMQLLEMGIPMVIALNMMDELVGNRGSIDVNTMEAMLGVPIIPISAAKNEGVDELIRHAVHVAKYQEPPLKQDFCDKDDHGGAVHRCIHAVIHLIEDHAALAGLPVRFAATKAIEGDALILQQLQLDRNEQEMLEHIVRQMETERGLDRSAAIADMRFDFIERLCAQTVIRPQESKERIRSEKIDRILTGRYTAIPCFIGIMVLVFYLTFNVIGGGLQKLLELGIDRLSALTDTALTQLHVNPVIHSLVIDGIFTGVGSVLSFLPIIVTLFFFLSLMEDSGYIARVAFVMDKLLRRIGLSGKSIVPMLIGFGCTVPAVMATRTLTSERDRKMTILLTPFMSCTAKLPIYSFFVSVFFPGKGGLIMSGLYLLGILVGIGAAFLYKDTLFRGEPIPFVMELPNYRLPSVKNVAQLLWEKAKDFLQRAFSVILIATVVVWFLQSFDTRLNVVADSANSLLALIGQFIAPIFRPLGFGDWQSTVATVTGLIAKEEVVNTFGVLYNYAGEIDLMEDSSPIWTMVAGDFNGITAYSFMIFNLLCAPCFAAMGAIKREMNNAKWTWFAIGYQCGFAYLCALMVNQFGKAFTGSLNVIGLVAAIAALAFIIYMLVRPYKEATKLSTKV